MMLKKYNCDVTTYTEPVSAIEELKNNKYDILILNFLMMPVNGDRIVELVREFDKEIYIILMSTHNDLVPSIDLMKKMLVANPKKRISVEEILKHPFLKDEDCYTNCNLPI